MTQYFYRFVFVCLCLYQPLFAQGHIICFEGPLGVGKSTLCQNLVEYYREQQKQSYCFTEFVNDDLVKHGYTKNALAFDLFMLCYCSRNATIAEERKQQGALCFLDHSPQGDEVYSDISLREKRMKFGEKRVFDSVAEMLGRPIYDLVIVLYVNPEVIFERIRRRNRDCEEALSFARIESIARQYYAGILEKFPDAVVLDWSEMDMNKIVALIDGLD